MRYGFRCLLVVLVALAPWAVAQCQVDDLGRPSRVCLLAHVLVDGERVVGVEEAVLELLGALAGEAGIRVRVAHECGSPVFDAASEIPRIVLILQMRTLPGGGYVLTYDLSEVRDHMGEFSSSSVDRITGVGIAVEAGDAAVLVELAKHVFGVLAASWPSVFAASEVVRETSERREGPTPNGGAYSITYYRDARGVPTTRDRARSVEIIEYDVEGEAIHSTIGYLNPQHRCRSWAPVGRRWPPCGAGARWRSPPFFGLFGVRVLATRSTAAVRFVRML